MPSALLPSTCQTSFHCAPAAMTPAMAVTAFSLGPAAAAAGGGPPFPFPPLPLPGGGGVLQVLIRSGYFGSDGACTPGPLVKPAGGACWLHAIAAPKTPIVSIAPDLIEDLLSAFQNIKTPI